MNGKIPMEDKKLRIENFPNLARGDYGHTWTDVGGKHNRLLNVVAGVARGIFALATVGISESVIGLICFYQKTHATQENTPKIVRTLKETDSGKFEVIESIEGHRIYKLDETINLNKVKIGSFISHFSFSGVFYVVSQKMGESPQKKGYQLNKIDDEFHLQSKDGLVDLTLVKTEIPERPQIALRHDQV